MTKYMMCNCVKKCSIQLCDHANKHEFVNQCNVDCNKKGVICIPYDEEKLITARMENRLTGKEIRIK